MAHVIAFLTLCFISVSEAQVTHSVIEAPLILPNTTEAMRTPDFWIGRLDAGPDEIVLTPEEIMGLNRNFNSKPLDMIDVDGDPYTVRDFITSYDRIGIQASIDDPLEMSTFPGDSLDARFRIARDWFMGRRMWDRRRLPYTGDMKQALMDEYDITSIPHTITPEYGILVRHTLHRIMPTHLPAYWGQYAWQDLFQSTGLESGMPVAILHRTRDAAWLYVKTVYSFGWVPAENVAIGTREQIRHASEPERFIVSLDHKIPVFADSNFSVWITYFYLGARMALVEKTNKGYRVQTPVRNPDNSLAVMNCWVKPDATVSVGYQPFTRRNMIETAFRLLDRPYGWGGSRHERSCSETVRTILKTFGIIVSRGMLQELHYPDRLYVVKENASAAQKYAILDRCDPGMTLCGSRQHIVIYLGKVNGSQHVIHSNGYSYHDKDGTEIRVGRNSVNDMELEGGSHIDTITEISCFSGQQNESIQSPSLIAE